MGYIKDPLKKKKEKTHSIKVMTISDYILENIRKQQAETCINKQLKNLLFEYKWSHIVSSQLVVL